MTERKLWIAAALTLALVAAAGVAAVTTVSAPGGAGVVDPVAEVAGQECPADADVVHAIEVEPGDDVVEPAAVCRLLPECFTNSDCDARCGAGQGKCVHSNCPVRLCRCR